MILDTTQWLLGSEQQAWYGLGWISWEFSYGNAPASTATTMSEKQFIGEIQQLGISGGNGSVIFDASMGVT